MAVEKLELRQRKKYVGLERGFPGSLGLGKPNRGGQGETSQDGAGREKGGRETDSREWEKGGNYE